VACCEAWSVASWGDSQRPGGVGLSVLAAKRSWAGAGQSGAVLGGAYGCLGRSELSRGGWRAGRRGAWRAKAELV
jgi:hypothetical protein